MQPSSTDVHGAP